MKFAYPQDPTRSVSAMRRYDESSDAATQQSNLERQQDIATVGETVPMLFCRRQDFGQDQGVNGGVWISPRLIQLGLEGTDLSMMYLLSQGKVEGLSIDNVHWGYPTLASVDPDAEFCAAYEAVPECLDLDYEPGGSLTWITTINTAGPSGEGSFVTSDNCTKIKVLFNSDISVSGSGQIASGYTGVRQIFKDPYSGNFVTYQTSGWSPTFYGPQSTLETLYYSGTQTDTGPTIGNPNIIVYYYRFSAKHFSASWYQTSEIQYRFRLFKKSDMTLLNEWEMWVPHGAKSFEIDSLEPDIYELIIDNEYKERNASYQTITYAEPDRTQGQAAWNNEWFQAPPSPPPTNVFLRHTNPGSETKRIESLVTQTIENSLEFPDVPGGGQQLVGGLSDLTVIGIRGDILKLRPQGGPDYFTQSHLFVENGIEVERLLDGQTGSSGLYADLVKYLMQSTKLLKDDQIDFDSLITAARMNQRYALFFNGVLQTTNSLAEWMTRTAPYFLLTPRQVNGRYGVAPIAPVNTDYELSRDPIVPVMTFGHDEIVAGSYQRAYISNKDRRPICLVMVYRDQPVQSVGQTVTVEVRYPGSALSGPFEQHDMTEFCCRAEHCVYAARYILAKRRYTTHTCSLSVNRQGRLINPGDIVQVNLNVETSDGQGITDQMLYQVESVSEGQLGTVDLELMHFPVDEAGISMIAKEVHEGEVSIQ